MRDKIIEVLNRMIEEDQEAVNEMFNTRFKCNEVLAEDKTIQVRNYPDDPGFSVGVLGLINGFIADPKDYKTGICMIVWPTCSAHGQIKIEKFEAGDPCPECGKKTIFYHIEKFAPIDSIAE